MTTATEAPCGGCEHCDGTGAYCTPAQVQQRETAGAVLALFEFATVHELTICGMTIGEHADGSGRWHVLASACTRSLGDRSLRVLIDPDGQTSPVQEIGR